MHQMAFLIYNLVIFPIGMLIVNDDFVRFFLGKDFKMLAMPSLSDLPYVLHRMDQYHGDSEFSSRMIRTKNYAVHHDFCYRQCQVEPALLTPILVLWRSHCLSILTESLVWLIQLYAPVITSRKFQLSVR